MSIGDGKEIATASAGSVQSSAWVASRDYNIATKATFRDVPPGRYDLAVGLYDKTTKRVIELPLAGRVGGYYRIGSITVTADPQAPR